MADPTHHRTHPDARSHPGTHDPHDPDTPHAPHADGHRPAPGHTRRPDDAHGQGHGGGHDHGAAGEQEFAALLDLDAEVLHELLAEVTGWVAAHTDGAPVRRFLDLGSGTGTGTLALLGVLDGAEAVAVDRSPHLLQHLRARAADLGLADRVHTVAADLDAGWPSVGTADLVWMSASLHHLADPDRVLREAFAALRPGGLLALVETDGSPRVLPDDLGLGRPGLEDRCRAALAARHAEALPHLGADWEPRLARAGYTVEERRDFAVDLRPPLPEPAGRYAQTLLRRMRAGVDGLVDGADLADLDALTAEDAPDGVLRRPGGLALRTGRTVWIARRPAASG